MKENKLGIWKGWTGGRLGLEKWLYFLHRLAGLLILLYLWLHIFVVGSRAFGEKAWEITMGAVLGPVFRFLEYLLVVLLVFHGFNGLRLILIEWLGIGIGKPALPIYPYPRSNRRARPLFVILMVIAFVYLLLSAWAFVKG